MKLIYLVLHRTRMAPLILLIHTEYVTRHRWVYIQTEVKSRYSYISNADSGFSTLVFQELRLDF